MRNLICFFLIVLCSRPLYAEPIKIAKSDQVQNYSDIGFCSWCCLETLGRHHNVKSLSGLAKNRRAEPEMVLVDYGGKDKKWHKNNVGVEWAIYNKLKELKVKFYYQPIGDKSHDLIKYAMENKLACMYAVKPNAWRQGSEAHAMIIVDFNDKDVLYLDPNYPGSVYSATRAWFDYYWTGMLVVILPDETTAKVVASPPNSP